MGITIKTADGAEKKLVELSALGKLMSSLTELSEQSMAMDQLVAYHLGLGDTHQREMIEEGLYPKWFSVPFTEVPFWATRLPEGCKLSATMNAGIWKVDIVLVPDRTYSGIGKSLSSAACIALLRYHED